MSVTHTLASDTAVYPFTGPFDRDTAQQFLTFNSNDYNDIGDVLDAIMDYRQIMRFPISGLCLIQENLRGQISPEYHFPRKQEME
jgi:hypothetical protein